MYRKLADTIILDFTVHLPTTGAISDADALPTVEIWEDETDTTLAGGTVTKRVGKTGNYRVAVIATAANGFEVGKSYNVVVTVVAGGVTAKAVIGSFFIDSKRLADLNDLGGTVQSGDAFARLGAAGAGLTALGDTRIANLDAAITTRSTLTAQQVWEYATRTISSFGTLVADAAAAVWASVTRSLTDKAGFTISGTKQTLDSLQDLSQAGAQAGTSAALTAYGAALEATLTAIKGGGWSTQTLVAISALVDDLEGRLTAARAGYLDELGAANLPTDIDSLLARLTALRAGYLDNLSAGAVALEAQVQTHAAAALAAYDPPTRAEATSDKAEITALATKVLQVLANRLVVVPATGGYTIYADDGVTPLITGTISGTGRSVPTWP